MVVENPDRVITAREAERVVSDPYGHHGDPRPYDFGNPFFSTDDTPRRPASNQLMS